VVKDLITALWRALRRSQPHALIADATLRRFAAASQDLADDEVMVAAWR
jgi:hypothetical protein